MGIRETGRFEQKNTTKAFTHFHQLFDEPNDPQELQHLRENTCLSKLSAQDVERLTRPVPYSVRYFKSKRRGFFWRLITAQFEHLLSNATISRNNLAAYFDLFTTLYGRQNIINANEECLKLVKNLHADNGQSLSVQQFYNHPTSKIILTDFVETLSGQIKENPKERVNWMVNFLKKRCLVYKNKPHTEAELKTILQELKLL
ncbi:hypothetical protein MTBPR1_20102 [Candidatus Terasakiella magnetica]|uniref:Uncharacterized protein n=1 Tax=Candidatus Terasakiella magnetica TaxID=1867952 RepID=A0A1C3RGC0_9PROT|nr:hypothetical protein [Candidatus Terasakiella magnetica]SCA56254.1 hypothetical protein MTBPR1_20102 [Candidatus Terasakiella magnetica]